MSDEEVVQECIEMEDAIYKLIDGQPAMVCVIVLTKLIGEVLFSMQLDPTDRKEGADLLEKARLSVFESYTSARDDGTSDHVH
jgi:hypothetical protein